MLISQVVLIPVFAVVIWGYFFFTAACKDQRFAKLYDAMLICLATLLSLLMACKIYSLNYDDYVSTWRQVFTVLASVHVFPLTMLAGMALKLKLFRDPANKP